MSATGRVVDSSSSDPMSDGCPRSTGQPPAALAASARGIRDRQAAMPARQSVLTTFKAPHAAPARLPRALDPLPAVRAAELPSLDRRRHYSPELARWWTPSDRAGP